LSRLKYKLYFYTGFRWVVGAETPKMYVKYSLKLRRVKIKRAVVKVTMMHMYVRRERLHLQSV